MAWRTNELGGWIVGLLLLAACTSDPEQVVSGDDTGSGESAITETTTVGSSALPVPSQWWLIDDGGAQTEEAISFFNAGNDGLLTVAFTDGCVRSAERLAEPGSYEIVGPVENDAVCVTWVSEPFFVGAQFEATVDGDIITIELGDLRIDGVAIESVSDPESVTPTTTVVVVLDDPVGVTTTFGPEVWIDPLDALIVDPGRRWGDTPWILNSVDGIDGWPDWELLIPSTTGDFDCNAAAELLGAIPVSATATARDEVRELDLDQRVYDLGPAASQVADVIRQIPLHCSRLDLGETNSAVVGAIDLDRYTLAMSLTDSNGETAWILTEYRNNVVSLLALSETGGDSLSENDLDEFRRLAKLQFDALADG